MNDVQIFLETLWNKNEIREVRILGENSRGYPENFYGFFDSPGKIFETLKTKFSHLNGNYQFFITLNPCNPALIARVANRIKHFGKKDKATGDNDIAKLRYFLLDCDPVRPAGISSTDEELKKALDFLEKIIKDLGKPLVTGMSGNGGHAIYYHNAKSATQVKTFLAELAKKYNSEYVKVDTSVYNSAQITKILGTAAKKGDSTRERPHRVSKILEINKDSPILDLNTFSTQENISSTSPAASGTHNNIELVRDFLSRHGLANQEKTHLSGYMFCLEACAFDSEHKGNESAVIVQDSGRIIYQCFHNSCQGRTWPELREMLGGAKIDKPIICKYCGKDIFFKDKKPVNADGKPHRCKKEKSVATQQANKKHRVTTDEYLAFFTEKGWNFRLNEILDEIYLNDERLADVKIANIKASVRDWCILNNYTIDINHAVDAISVMADKNHFHPVRDFLNNLPAWDQKPRIAELAAYFGHDGNFGRWLEVWLAGTILRTQTGAHHPMLVLSGPQDIGKSYFARWLCPIEGFYNDSGIHPDDKDSRLKILTCWIWEVGELGASTRRTDIDALKAFLSLEIIRERKPWGHFELVKPALASFIGTVNADFLIDRTGNRRFLTTEIKSINWDYSHKIDKMQLWAQAIQACQEKKYDLSSLDKIERDLANEENMTSDPIEIFIEHFFEFTGFNEDFVIAADILSVLREKSIPITRSTAMVISEIMKKKGASKTRKRFQTGQRPQRGFTGVKQVYDGNSSGGWG